VLTPLDAVWTGLVYDVGEAGFVEQTFDEWIDIGIHAADPDLRFYPMPEFSDSEDQTEDDVEWADAYGNVYPVRSGNLAIMQAYKRDSCLSVKLNEFNGQEFRVILFDGTGNVEVAEVSGGYAGKIANFWHSQPKYPSATELTEGHIMYKFTNPEEHANRQILATDLHWSDIEGLEDITMNIALVSTDLVITFESVCGEVDLTSELSAISEVTTAWKGDTATVIADLTTAPTYDPATKTFSIEAASVTATKIKLADPSILYGLGVTNKDHGTWVTVPS
jgi:hypothetical protein